MFFTVTYTITIKIFTSLQTHIKWKKCLHLFNTKTLFYAGLDSNQQNV